MYVLYTCLTRCTETRNTTGNVQVTWHRGAYVQPLLKWKSKQYYILLVCVCSLRYAACNAVCLIVICGLSASTFFFSRCLINGKIFGGGVIIHKICELSLQLLSEIFCILRRTKRDMIINVKCPLLSDFDNT